MCLEAVSWKAEPLSPFITGGVQAEQCVLTLTEDSVETFLRLSAQIRLRQWVCVYGLV